MSRFGQRLARVMTVGGLAIACVMTGSGAAHAAGAAYTALGDSYSSGVGTRSYTYDNTSCKRSNYAYPVLDAQRLGLTLTFAACSGARVPDVLNQLGSLSASTADVTVTVGGNDAGFSSVITQCAKPWPYTCGGDIDKAQTYIRNTLPGVLDGLYTKIHTLAPNAKVVVVGYPRLFNGQQCNAGARISPDEMSRLNDTSTCSPPQPAVAPAPTVSAMSIRGPLSPATRSVTPPSGSTACRTRSPSPTTPTATARSATPTSSKPP
ncbi:SGNH/GDSL hydrolase family protein [Fodinicola feengrottensis]|uniref:SGNH/GDSL hydrolase family protein n=1 Tax=Fodinicola feengrottensis TaxID=435914 RepID=UPI0024410FC8|nr:SGNH/GDSL hydrolase family protein [Fodinicola feengrottensis]